ncbi:MAG: hypothetical protein E7311_02165 [Clostridiales bacterium]|nr:hypothetical protein [Clostridiales bacterium]
MKKVKFVIAFVIITNMLLLNICYGKQVMINEKEFSNNKLTNSVIKSLQKNTFTVEEEKDDLVKISINNKSIWIQKKYVVEINNSANNITQKDDNEVLDIPNGTEEVEGTNIYKFVNTDLLNVREENSTTSSKIAKIKKDTKVEVLKTENGWDYIRVDGILGWVSNEYLIDEKTTTEEIITKPQEDDRGINKEVYITANSLNVRDGASSSANKIGSLTYYKTASVVGIEDGWYKIKFNGGYGYISAEYTIDKSELASRGDYDRDDNEAILASSLADKALSYVGHKYVYGGTSPSGFDCSGLVYYVYKSYVNQLPRGAMKQSKIGTYIEKENLQKGDLVFFGNYGNGVVEHVGIYIGDGNFVHAANSKRGVVVDTLESGYYNTNYILARRVI